MDVQVKDGKAVISHNFTEEEYFTARCIGAACFPSEGVVIVDLKTTRSRALLEFFKAYMLC
jgi:K+-transporting ATPase c subunit